jgi:carbonic anhydrase
MAEQLSVPQRLFALNARWAKDVEKAEPDFFCRSAEGPQKPHTLWIGCSDSRVPESVITNSRPGDIFVHRNIANQLHLKDDNVLSVLAYAVEHLLVKHVVIVGHSECGGAAACIGAVQSPKYPELGPAQTLPDNSAEEPLNRWLAPLTELVASLNISTLPKSEALPIVVEENVKRQVQNLCQTATIKLAWEKGQEVSVHGWVYDLSTGQLKDLEISKSA